MNTSDRIRSARIRAKLSVVQAADKSGVSWRTWYRLESGELDLHGRLIETQDTMRRISEALGFDTEALFGR